MSENIETPITDGPKIKENIKSSLFSEERFQNYPEKSKDQLSQIIANHTVRITNILELDPSEVSFGISTEEKVGKGNTNRAALHVEFDKQQNTTFSVLYSPDELEVDLKILEMPVTQPFVEELITWSLAHELHHLKQFKDNRAVAMKSADSAKGEEWEYASDEGEIAARMFALRYTANRDIPLYKIIEQNTRLFFVIGQIALEGYARVRGKLKR